MKHLFLALALALGLSVAGAQDIVPAETVKQAQAQAKEKCKEGCLVLSPKDIVHLEMGMQEALMRAYQEGKYVCNKSTKF